MYDIIEKEVQMLSTLPELFFLLKTLNMALALLQHVASYSSLLSNHFTIHNTSYCKPLHYAPQEYMEWDLRELAR